MKITQGDYYKLLGLRAMANELNIQMQSIELAAASITKEEREYDGPGGYPATWEEICSERDGGDIRRLLARCEIEVVPDPLDNPLLDVLNKAQEHCAREAATCTKLAAEEGDDAYIAVRDAFDEIHSILLRGSA